MEATATPQSQAAPPPRLRERYEQDVLPALTGKFGYSTPMQAPRLEKITLNMGLGEAKQNAKMMEAAQEQLATIAGQQPSVRRARKSIASFKVREGMPVGMSVTLRRARMWEFLDRLCSIAVPRIRDFRGLNPRSFDGRGNYSMGVKEQLIFPEIDYDSIDEVRGLDITITTSAPTDEEAFELLLGLGMPFAKEGRPGKPEPTSRPRKPPRRRSTRRRHACAPRLSRRRWSNSRKRTPTLTLSLSRRVLSRRMTPRPGPLPRRRRCPRSLPLPAPRCTSCRCGASPPAARRYAGSATWPAGRWRWSASSASAAGSGPT